MISHRITLWTGLVSVSYVHYLTASLVLPSLNVPYVTLAPNISSTQVIILVFSVLWMIVQCVIALMSVIHVIVLLMCILTVPINYATHVQTIISLILGQEYVIHVHCGWVIVWNVSPVLNALYVTIITPTMWLRLGRRLLMIRLMWVHVAIATKPSTILSTAQHISARHARYSTVWTVLTSQHAHSATTQPSTSSTTPITNAILVLWLTVSPVIQ